MVPVLSSLSISFNFCGQIWISSTNLKEQPECWKGFSHWAPFFGLFCQQDWVATIQPGLWINFPLSNLFFRVFLPNPISITELWNIPRFQCWNISEIPWPMWDSLRPDWNVIRIVWLGSKINRLDESRIESKIIIESNQIKTTIELNPVGNGCQHGTADSDDGASSGYLIR